MEYLLAINQQLAEKGFTLKRYDPNDEAQLYGIFREVIDTGSQFPYECNSKEEFHRQFLDSKSQVYVCHSLNNEVVGGFYVRSNYPGRASHIANAAYMIKSDFQGKGVGTLLIKGSLRIAKNLGFRAMQFNMVLSQNSGAVRLYQKLGFEIQGIIPKAVRNLDGTFQDGYLMYRNLDDINDN